MAETAKSNARKKTTQSSNSNTQRATPSPAGHSGQGQESADDAGNLGTATRTRAQAVRRNEQLLVLTLAIVCGLIGFPLHLFWIIAIVLMALLWGYMASELGRSRRGGVISGALTAIATETRQITKEVSDTPLDSGNSDDATTSNQDAEHHEHGPEISQSSNDQQQPTKKELYEEAREAGIEGRSNMTKEELKQALDE